MQFLKGFAESWIVFPEERGASKKNSTKKFKSLGSLKILTEPLFTFFLLFCLKSAPTSLSSQFPDFLLLLNKNNQTLKLHLLVLFGRKFRRF